MSTFTCHACGEEKEMSHIAFSVDKGEGWLSYCSECYFSWIKFVSSLSVDGDKCCDKCPPLKYEHPKPKLRLIKGGVD